MLGRLSWTILPRCGAFGGKLKRKVQLHESQARGSAFCRVRQGTLRVSLLSSFYARGTRRYLGTILISRRETKSRSRDRKNAAHKQGEFKHRHGIRWHRDERSHNASNARGLAVRVVQESRDYGVTRNAKYSGRRDFRRFFSNRPRSSPRFTHKLRLSRARTLGYSRAFRADDRFLRRPFGRSRLLAEWNVNQPWRANAPHARKFQSLRKRSDSASERILAPLCTVTRYDIARSNRFSVKSPARANIPECRSAVSSAIRCLRMPRRKEQLRRRIIPRIWIISPGSRTRARYRDLNAQRITQDLLRSAIVRDRIKIESTISTREERSVIRQSEGQSTFGYEAGWFICFRSLLNNRVYFICGLLDMCTRCVVRLCTRNVFRSFKV